MVILVSVFFAMGYIVGRNSAPATVVDARNTPPAANKPLVVEPPRASSQDQTTAQQPAPEAPPPAAPETKPSPAPEEQAAAPPPSRPAPEKRTEAPSERARTTAVERPAAGRYWQVVSTSRPEAEIVSESLSKKGLRSIVAPAPKEGYFRVLVGPLGDTSNIAQIRSQLESAGFKPILQHY